MGTVRTLAHVLAEVPVGIALPDGSGVTREANARWRESPGVPAETGIFSSWHHRLPVLTACVGDHQG